MPSLTKPPSFTEQESRMDTTVEGLSLWLEGFDGILAAPEPVSEIERRLLNKLESPVRLLRWAIVKVEDARFLCEGAYLKQAH